MNALRPVFANSAHLLSPQVNTLANSRVIITPGSANTLQPGYYDFQEVDGGYSNDSLISVLWGGVQPNPSTASGPIALTLTESTWQIPWSVSFALTRPLSVVSLVKVTLGWWASADGPTGAPCLMLRKLISIADPGVFPPAVGPFQILTPLPGVGPWTARVRDLALGSYDYTVEGSGPLASVGIIQLFGAAQVEIFQGVIS